MLALRWLWSVVVGRAPAPSRVASLAALAGVLMASATAPAVLAQGASGTVRGTVTDSATGRPVAGVQMTVAGAPARAATSEAGTYQLTGVPAGRVTVRAQRLGYAAVQRTVDLTAGSTVTLDIRLRPVAAVLSTVVATGYGSSRRATVSNAIASVDSSAFDAIPVVSVDNALQGRVPGVQVMQNSGEPGGGVSVRIRGPASLNAGSQPLYVIDGVPMLQGTFEQITGTSGQRMTPISGINPDDIASIDVLKDAAAAAIYGSRGSNGVVVITTKRGAGGNRFRFNMSAYTASQQVEKKVDLLNASEYVAVMNEARTNQGLAPRFAPGTDSISTDWQDAVFRQAPMSEVNLSVSGGTDRLRMFLSGSDTRQTGIVIGSDYQRQALRLNTDAQATSKLTITSNIGLTRESNDRVPGDQNIDGIVTNALAMQPFSPVRGNVFGFAGIANGLIYSNPVATATYSSLNVNTLRALGNTEARYAVSDRISLSARLGTDIYALDELRWRSPKVDRAVSASVGGEGANGRTRAYRFLAETFGNWDVLDSDNQTLRLTAGASQERNSTNFNYVAGTGFPTGFERYVRNAAQVSVFDGGETENTLVSYFSRANWTWRERYVLTASLRRDGSSRFGDNSRYGNFAALSGAWTVSDETWAGALSRLMTLKLRASRGTTGNQQIADFGSRTLAAANPYAGVAGLAPSQLGNPNLRWERTTETDVGADMGILNGRVNVVVDWYNRASADLLVTRPVAATSGYTTVADNVGSLRNRGVDLQLQTVNIRRPGSGGFEWTSDLNITWNRNLITALSDGQPVNSTTSGRLTSVAMVGKPIGTFFVFDFLRVDPATGNAIYRRGDGGETTSPVTADLSTNLGSAQPDYFGGLTNAMRWKGFDLRAFLQFTQGNEILNMNRLFADDGGNSSDNKFGNVRNRWQKPGDITNQPRMGSTGGARFMSDRFIEDGSFVRLQEVTLGWRLPASLAKQMRADNARLYVSGRNLVTWTNYTGYNPDVNSAGTNANLSLGVDFYAYPLARTWTVGINAGW
ncbi:MAG: SusC/RagA family TonB-linked outer membrane protein [Gemmatimonas sp.]|uniref:SusC/RagA family TonB-linked outer membrane protein n=1 Tax=Gemmatimonas sp. TaxID=1962908 RepID=UPI00391F76B7